MLSPSTGSTHILSELSECLAVGGGGGVFASFLPGIAIALTKLVTTDTAKVGQVICSCSEKYTMYDLLTQHKLSFFLCGSFLHLDDRLSLQ